MNPVSGYSHFTKWKAKRQEQCVRACGLALREYRNKPARVGVITKLLANDLPLDTEAVKRELRERNVPIATHHATKLVRQLLDKMTGHISVPVVTSRRIQALSSVKN